MATQMTQDVWRAFVSEGTRTGKVSTVRADGTPHVAPVWFLLDDGDLVFTTSDGTVKGRNLLRDDRAAICVDDERPPFSFVILRGRVTVSKDLDEVLGWATRIAVRYMGQDRAEEVGRRNTHPGAIMVRMRVEQVNAWADIAA